jgi:Na+/H+ antiporter NhaD/arsenite permease-like protein
MLAAIPIFAATYLAMGIGRMLGLRIDRTGAAIVGASLTVATDVLRLDDAWAAIPIFAATCLARAVVHMPRPCIDHRRASMMAAANLLTFDDAWAAIDSRHASA